MLNKIVAGILNWLVVSIVMPVMHFVYDKYKLRQENKRLKQVIEDLKNAKTKDDIDTAIDNLP